MACVPVEEVHERARRQQQERQVLEHVRPVLGDQKKARDQQEAPEHVAAFQLRLLADSQPNTAPSPKAQIVMPTSAYPIATVAASAAQI